jgi:hypothetical protein
MTTFHELLTMLYQIQGLSDPNDSPATQAERLKEINELASKAMDDSGFQPD